MQLLKLGAIGSLVLLCLINLTNYIDRYLIVSLGELIKSDLKLEDREVGLLLSVFVAVYVVTSPVLGWIADRVARKYVIGWAVALWSVATALASRAPSFGPLLQARAAVGIGEAGYNAAGQALLVDLFPPARRNNVLALFNAAVPIGSAIGFLLGGMLPKIVAFGQPLGWRGACLWVGLPGLVLALAAFSLPHKEKTEEKSETASEAASGTIGAYKRFLTDPVYMTNALGYAMQAFALGGLSAWAPSFFMRTHGLDHEKASMLSGGVVVAAGAVGTLAGSVLADKLARGNLIRSYGLVTGVGYLAAGPLLAAGLFMPPAFFQVAVGLVFLSMIGTFLGTGPTNAICTERAPEAFRASAFALLVVIIHVLGDAASPVVVGETSTLLTKSGSTEAVALQTALLLAPIALMLGGALMLLCALFAHRLSGQPQSAESARASLPKTEDGTQTV